MYNLLIADDESIVRRGIKTYVDFSALGIGEIYEAENGEAALEIVKSREVHIAFADINMPRMNGLDFTKKAKEYDSFIRIALITGYDYFDYALTALKIGADDYILKPVSKDDVTELLISLIEKRKAADKISALVKAADRIAELTGVSDEETLKKTLLREIENNLGSAEFSLSVLAEKVGYNTTYLSTLFKKYYGANFRDYLLELRLERAKILLLSTGMKSYEIAEAIGMEDANYLSACFKRKFGTTISEFRGMGRRT